jgi:hypothetical protein
MTTDTTAHPYTPMPTYTYYDWNSLRAADFTTPTPSALRFLGMMHQLRERGSDYILPNDSHTSFVAHLGTNNRNDLRAFNDACFGSDSAYLNRHLLAYLDMLTGLTTNICIRITGDLSQSLYHDALQTYRLTPTNNIQYFPTDAATWFTHIARLTSHVPQPDPNGHSLIYYYLRYAISNEDWPTYESCALISCDTPLPFHPSRNIESFNAPARFRGSAPERVESKLTLLDHQPFNPYTFACHASNYFTLARTSVASLHRLNAAHKAINADHILLNNIVEKSAACQYPTALAHAIRNQCTPGTADMINQYGPDHGARIYDLLHRANFPDLDEITFGEESACCCRDGDCGDCPYCNATSRVEELEEIIADARRELENA